MKTKKPLTLEKEKAEFQKTFGPILGKEIDQIQIIQYYSVKKEGKFGLHFFHIFRENQTQSVLT